MRKFKLVDEAIWQESTEVHDYKEETEENYITILKAYENGYVVEYLENGSRLFIDCVASVEEAKEYVKGSCYENVINDIIKNLKSLD